VISLSRSRMHVHTQRNWHRKKGHRLTARYPLLVSPRLQCSWNYDVTRNIQSSLYQISKLNVIAMSNGNECVASNEAYWHTRCLLVMSWLSEMPRLILCAIVLGIIVMQSMIGQTDMHSVQPECKHKQYWITNQKYGTVSQLFLFIFRKLY